MIKWSWLSKEKIIHLSNFVDWLISSSSKQNVLVLSITWATLSTFVWVLLEPINNFFSIFKSFKYPFFLLHAYQLTSNIEKLGWNQEHLRTTINFSLIKANSLCLLVSLSATGFSHYKWNRKHVNMQMNASRYRKYKLVDILCCTLVFVSWYEYRYFTFTNILL